ncbi:MAG: hypothetical protein H5T63_07260, partial [Chloroflexi bacterium]|nr:hypothetical protein [Chloroflexota bacterium]
MNKIRFSALCILILAIGIGCRSVATPTPAVPTPLAQPTLTAPPATPTLKVWPTALTPAPDEPVVPIGYSAVFQDTQHNVSGKAVMAGLQTIVISGFTYDGLGPPADIRLVKGEDFDHAVAILVTLEQRPYDQEWLVLT